VWGGSFPPQDRSSSTTTGKVLVTDHSRGPNRPTRVRAPRASPGTAAAAGPVPDPDVGPGAMPDRSALEVEVDTEVRDLLLRVTAQERLAQDAASDLEDFFAWPSWSMDTGLTPAQERFVEHWSPQRVLDDSRSVRQLVRLLQGWTSVRDDEAGLDEALAVLANLSPR
jgi:hypothetical protein